MDPNIGSRKYFFSRAIVTSCRTSPTWFASPFWPPACLEFLPLDVDMKWLLELVPTHKLMSGSTIYLAMLTGPLKAARVSLSKLVPCALFLDSKCGHPAVECCLTIMGTMLNKERRQWWKPRQTSKMICARLRGCLNARQHEQNNCLSASRCVCGNCLNWNAKASLGWAKMFG